MDTSTRPFRSGPPRWGLVALLGLLGVLCVVIIAVGVWLGKTLAGDPPGQGAKAEAGYQASQPIIAALEQYGREKGEYPDSLEALVPTYLPALPGPVNGYPIDYAKKDSGYELMFSYEGPGMNRCTYTPEAEWNCYGYY